MTVFPALRHAALWLKDNGYAVPDFAQAALKGLLDLTAAASQYSQDLMEALHNYNEGRMGMVEARNDFRQTMTASFMMAFDAGYEDGGGDPNNETSAAIDWLYNRQEQETQNILDLFFTLKQAKADDPTMDVGSWISDRSAGYAGTLNDVYSHGKVFGAGDRELTFDGDDGTESCPDCQRMKGQTHPASWWIENDMVPHQGNTNYECGGWRCQHGLVDNNGNWFTADPTIFR